MLEQRFKNDVLTQRRRKEPKDRLNHWYFIRKEYGLKTGRDTTVTISISKNPDTNIRPKVDRVVKEVYKCIWDVIHIQKEKLMISIETYETLLILSNIGAERFQNNVK
jgi:hypothetical protein